METLYKLAERFHSIQGEGTHAGVQMHFVRLAGCNVGKYTQPDVLRSTADTKDGDERRQLRVLAMERERHPNYSICESALGHKFLCDTIYNHVAEVMTAEQIIANTYEKHLCITGGEPFLHNLAALITAAGAAEKFVHIETSGSILIHQKIPPRELGNVWLTCSPKVGFNAGNVEFIDEYKFVVSKDQGLEVAQRIQAFLQASRICSDDNEQRFPVFIQPVNGIDTVDRGELEFVVQVLKFNPEWKLSCQLHKLIGLQ